MPNLKMKNTFDVFTDKHLDEISNVIKEENSLDDVEKENIEKKKSIVINNILSIKRQFTKLQNMNLFLQMSLDQNDNDRNEFTNDINQKIKKLNELINKTSEKNECEKQENLDKLTQEKNIDDHLIEFYEDKIEQSKIDKIEKGQLFNDFYVDQIKYREKAVNEQLENEKFYSQDELLSVIDFIQNVNEL